MHARFTMSRPVLALLILIWAAPPAAAQLTREQQAEFLRTARIVDSAPIGKGVTRPWRLTLSDGKLTHDAAFQSVDERSGVQTFGKGRRPELNFTDSWRFNIAAAELAVLLGIPDMVPVSVERFWNGKRGALTWWVDDVLMDEEERRKNNVSPPDAEAWNRQDLKMRVFTQLAYDTDRNQGNIIITKDWRIVMIDFTRAFRAWRRLPNPIHILRRCDRSLLEGMRRLTRDDIERTMRDHLTTFEINALLARRDIIVEHFDGLVAKMGEEKVLY